MTVRWIGILKGPLFSVGDGLELDMAFVILFSLVLSHGRFKQARSRRKLAPVLTLK